MQSCVSLKKIVGVNDFMLSHRPTVFPIILPPGSWVAKSMIFGASQVGSHRWMRRLLSSPSHLIRRSSSIVECQVAFTIGAWSIITARRTLVPISHIHIVVGMISVLVARRVPELSNDNIFVPVLFVSLLGDGVDVGGQVG